MLERETKYYQDHHADLFAEFADRVVVIKGEQVIGDYGTVSEAYAATAAEHEPGTFLIKRVTTDSQSEQQTFTSRVLAVA